MNFPSLPVLQQLKRYSSKILDVHRIYIVSVQHLVETTGSLFETLIDMGFLPGHIYLIGKIYSTNKEVALHLKEKGIHVFRNTVPGKWGHAREVQKKDISRMWAMAVKVFQPEDIIIALDDGGLAIRQSPIGLTEKYACYGIEQTTSGLRWQPSRPNVPIVQVATSAAKTRLEPAIIARAVHKKMEGYFKKIKPRLIGIVGSGHIGRSLALFFNRYYDIMIFDKAPGVLSGYPGKIKIAENMEELVSLCDVVVGATGIDISREIRWEELVRQDTTLISVSSNDTEFNSLIRAQNTKTGDQKPDILADLIIRLANGHSLTVIRGGTVVNFDNSKESCPADEIQLTRGLLLSGVLQILESLQNKTALSGQVKLSAPLQKAVVTSWLKVHPSFADLYPAELVENFDNEEWIVENS